MSLYSAMLAGVTGLQSNSTALAAISENIANVNTVGYKTNNTDFETLVTTATGEGAYSAGGVATTNTQFVNAQGSMTQTSSPTDLAVSGQGMFVTATQPASPTSASNQVLFTRAGSFTTDSAGNLVNSAGLYLLGWPANSDGTVTTSNILSSLQPINVNALSSAVSATTSASVSGNLNAEQPVSAAATAAGVAPPGAGAYNALTNSMTAYNASTGVGVQPDFTIQVPVSDSLGGQHTLQIDMLKSTTANQWYAEIQAVPASDVVSGPGLAPGQIASGIIAFNPDGSINMTKTTLFGTPTPTTPSITIGASNAAAPTGTQVNWAAGLGVNGQTIDLNIDPTTGSAGLTQFAGTNSAGNVITNGTTFGALSSVSVAANGTVNATFSNGTTRPIAQIAMATFPNEDGLTTVNGDAYQASAASGAYNLTTAGSNGAGKISSNALEASTVDLSTQFTALITTQSAYSAASKVITTADNMTQALLQIIQG